ncbi:MAG: SPFH domain-containing protein [Euryarchaeota archaeon]|nr:SPFH domain-containing protein [Euryarchaeota archaeon]
MILKREKTSNLEGADARKTFFWVDQYKGENVMWRLPHNIRWNDNVVVREDEVAVFFRDGKALHVFDRPGRYALTTENVPVLGTIVKKVTGVQQIGEIYYLQRRELRGKFGTSEPLSFRDPDFGVVRIRAFGQFAYKVTEPMVFITEFVGTKGYSKSEEVIEWLKDQIVMDLNDTVGELKLKHNMSILDLPAYLQEIEQVLLTKLKDDTARYGLEVTKIAGLNLNLPEEVQQAIDKRGAMAALGVNYMQYQTGKAIEDIGKGAAQGGSGGGMAELGAGMGAGLSMANAMGQSMQPAQGVQQAPPPGPQAAMKKCPECGKMVPGDAQFCPYCGHKFVEKKMKKCVSCGRDIPEDAMFCPYCGAKQEPAKMHCPNCGKEIPPDVAFCPYCGHKLK